MRHTTHFQGWVLSTGNILGTRNQANWTTMKENKRNHEWLSSKIISKHLSWRDSPVRIIITLPKSKQSQPFATNMHTVFGLYLLMSLAKHDVGNFYSVSTLASSIKCLPAKTFVYQYNWNREHAYILHYMFYKDFEENKNMRALVVREKDVVCKVCEEIFSHKAHSRKYWVAGNMSVFLVLNQVSFYVIITKEMKCTVT